MRHQNGQEMLVAQRSDTRRANYVDCLSSRGRTPQEQYKIRVHTILAPTIVPDTIAKTFCGLVVRLIERFLQEHRARCRRAKLDPQMIRHTIAKRFVDQLSSTPIFFDKDTKQF